MEKSINMSHSDFHLET